MPGAITAGNAEVNGAASITTNGGAHDLSFEDAGSLLNGNGTAPIQSESVAADVTAADDISVAQASDVLGTTYDILDDAATVASALTAGNAEVKTMRFLFSPTVVRLTFRASRTRNSLLNGNQDCAAQTGSVAADVTVTGTISVAGHRACLVRPTMLLMTQTVAAAMIAERVTCVNRCKIDYYHKRRRG